MANPILYTITMPNGHIYDLGDAYARELIKELLNFHEWLGITTTPIEDGDTTNPILINGVEVTAVLTMKILYCQVLVYGSHLVTCQD